MKKSRTAGTIALLAAAVFLFAGRQAKVKAADAAYVSGTADVRIIQTEASYSSGAEAAVSFSPKEADMDGMLDRPGAWACYMIEVQNQGETDAALSMAELRDETPAYIDVTSGVKDEHIGDVLKPGEKRRIVILLQWNPDDAAVSAGECGTYSLTLVFDGVSAIPDTSASSGLLWLTVGLAAATLAAGALYKRSRRIN